jgi:hypothetical protein
LVVLIEACVEVLTAAFDALVACAPATVVVAAMATATAITLNIRTSSSD